MKPDIRTFHVLSADQKLLHKISVFTSESKGRRTLSVERKSMASSKQVYVELLKERVVRFFHREVIQIKDLRTTHSSWFFRSGPAWIYRRKKLGITWDQKFVGRQPCFPFAWDTIPILVDWHLEKRIQRILGIDVPWTGTCVRKAAKQLPKSLVEQGREFWQGESGNSWFLQLDPDDSSVNFYKTHVLVHRTSSMEFKLYVPELGLFIVETPRSPTTFKAPGWTAPPKTNFLDSYRRRRGRESRIIFQSSNGTHLTGTLERPLRAVANSVAVLIHGSGPETGDSGIGFEGRNLCLPPLRFRELSRRLVEGNIAVFRYDKRGTGASGGKRSQIDRKVLLDDVIAAAHAVSKRTALPIYLVGFSEGANLAISAANACSKVRGIVLAAGPANPIDQVMVEKTAHRLKLNGVSPSTIRNESRRMNEIFTKIRSAVECNRSQASKILYLGYPATWWADHMVHNPSQEAKKLSIPVLILHGLIDADVLVSESLTLYRILKAHRRQATLKIFPHLGHMFSPAISGLPGYEYDVPQEFSSVFIRSLVQWLRRWN